MHIGNSILGNRFNLVIIRLYCKLGVAATSLIIRCFMLTAATFISEIATFLSSANPNWSKDDLRNMLNEHLVLTKAEEVARLTGNYTGDIATFDQIHKHANGMSDAIVAGIVKQFPEKFSTTVSTPSTTTVPSTK